LNKKQLANAIEALTPGDLVTVWWYDACMGKSLGTGVAVDVPVRSWGIFIGVLGEKVKCIVLAQNSFKYSDGIFDIDYTSIPYMWVVDILLITKGEVDRNVAEQLVNSFIVGKRSKFGRRTYQRKVRNHGLG
jgi:hypothetical protein